MVAKENQLLGRQEEGLSVRLGGVGGNNGACVGRCFATL